jgi:LacI family transcriptional regulator
MKNRSTPPAVSKPFPGGPVTLRHIAAATGYTVNTVSRALKGGQDISQATRTLIQNKARAMGYVPNALAVSLRSGRTRTISAIIPDITDPLFAIWIRDLESRLKVKDFDLFIQNTDENEDLERRAILAATAKKMDGIIMCPCQRDPQNTRMIRESGIPFVLMGRRFHEAQDCYVVADDVQGGYLATLYLLQKGHRDILFLNGPACISSARERLQGYRRALQEGGRPFRKGLVLEAAIQGGECSRLLAAHLRGGPRFTAVFCFSDLMALEAIAYLHTRGVRIPEEVAVVGFDDVQSRLFYPYPLTSIGYGKRAVAESAADLITGLVEGAPPAATRRQVIPVKLVVRGST